MDHPISELNELLATMSPVHNPGCYVITSTSDPASLTFQDVVASIQEPEGTSLIVCEQRAHELGLPILLRCAWITLTVHSDLQAVGLTASFARALADAGIACNVVAGARHDHIFVPIDTVAAAMNALNNLQSRALGARHSDSADIAARTAPAAQGLPRR
jgi:hypothetical protein